MMLARRRSPNGFRNTSVHEGLFKEQLENGTTLFGEQKREEFCAIGMIIPFGETHVGDELNGYPHGLEHLLFKSKTYRRTVQVRRNIEQIGGYLNAFTTHNAIAVYCSVPAGNTTMALEQLSHLLLRPAFTQEDVVAERKVILEEIRALHDDVTETVSDMCISSLHKGAYKRSVLGSPKNVESMHVSTVTPLWDRLDFSQMKLLLYGSFDYTQARSTAQALLAHPDFSANRNVLDSRPVFLPIHSTSAKIRRDLEQTHVSFGIHLPSDNDAAAGANYIFDTFLTFGEQSKFYQELREKRSLVYSATGRYDKFIDHQTYQIGFGTHPRNIPQCLALIPRIVKAAARMSLQDLRKVQEPALGALKNGMTHTDDIIQELLEREAYGVGFETYSQRAAKIKNATLESVRALGYRAARYYSLAFLGPQYPKGI